MGAVVGVDRAGEVDGVVGFLVAAGGEEDGCAAEGGCSDCAVDLHGDLLISFLHFGGMQEMRVLLLGEMVACCFEKDLGGWAAYCFSCLCVLVAEGDS